MLDDEQLDVHQRAIGYDVLMRCGRLFPFWIALGGCGVRGPDTNGFDDGVATFEFAEEVGFSDVAPMADGGLVAYGTLFYGSHLILRIDATRRPGCDAWRDGGARDPTSWNPAPT